MTPYKALPVLIGTENRCSIRFVHRWLFQTRGRLVDLLIRYSAEEREVKTATNKRQTAASPVPDVIADCEDVLPAEAAERRQFIATAAYYRAEARGFMPGMEMDDWLEAEAEYDDFQRQQ